MIPKGLTHTQKRVITFQETDRRVFPLIQIPYNSTQNPDRKTKTSTSGLRTRKNRHRAKPVQNVFKVKCTNLKQLFGIQKINGKRLDLGLDRDQYSSIPKYSDLGVSRMLRKSTRISAQNRRPFFTRADASKNQSKKASYQKQFNKLKHKFMQSVEHSRGLLDQGVSLSKIRKAVKRNPKVYEPKKKSNRKILNTKGKPKSKKLQTQRKKNLFDCWKMKSKNTSTLHENRLDTKANNRRFEIKKAKLNFDPIMKVPEKSSLPGDSGAYSRFESSLSAIDLQQATKGLYKQDLLKIKSILEQKKTFLSNLIVKISDIERSRHSLESASRQSTNLTQNKKGSLEYLSKITNLNLKDMFFDLSEIKPQHRVAIDKTPEARSTRRHRSQISSFRASSKARDKRQQIINRLESWNFTDLITSHREAGSATRLLSDSKCKARSCKSRSPMSGPKKANKALARPTQFRESSTGKGSFGRHCSIALDLSGEKESGNFSANLSDWSSIDSKSSEAPAKRISAQSPLGSGKSEHVVNLLCNLGVGKLRVQEFRSRCRGRAGLEKNKSMKTFHLRKISQMKNLSSEMRLRQMLTQTKIRLENE